MGLSLVVVGGTQCDTKPVVVILVIVFNTAREAPLKIKVFVDTS